MAIRHIGIEFGTDYIQAVQVRPENEMPIVEKIFTMKTRRHTDADHSILKALYTEHGFDRRARVAISLPEEQVFFRTIDNRSDAPAGNQTLLEHKFPLEPADAAVQLCTPGKSERARHFSLAVATRRSLLEEKLDDFKAAGVTPKSADTPVSGLYSATAFNHPEACRGRSVIVQIKASRLLLVVLHDGDLIAVRNLPLHRGAGVKGKHTEKEYSDLFAEQIRLTCQKHLDCKDPDAVKFFLAIDEDVREETAVAARGVLNEQTIVINPGERVEIKPKGKEAAQIAVAEGLALNLFLSPVPGAINFLDSISAGKHKYNFRKDLYVCGALTAAIVLTAFTGLFVNFRQLNNENSLLEDRISQVFKDTLPENTKLVRPLVQMEDELESLRQKQRVLTGSSLATPGPLDVLGVISRTLQTNKQIKLSEILMTNGTIRIKGSCSAFQAAYNWAEKLKDSPFLTNVEISGIQKADTDNTARFTLSAVCRETAYENSDT